MNINVLSLKFEINSLKIKNSASSSNSFVASSKIKISGLKYIDLAIATLCLWPPDILLPCSPISLSVLKLKLSFNLFIPEISVASL